MSDQPTKEELSTTVPERLTKEEMYAKYGPYVPADEWDRLKGKAPKMQQPYPLTQFPGVPDDMQHMFSLTSLKRTPEKNLRSLEILNGYKAMGVLNDQYTAPDLEPQAAITTTANLANMNSVAQNRINNSRLSRAATANLVEFNLQNKPEEYAKFAEAREQIGKAAKYYGTPEEVVQQATSNYLYNRYAPLFNDEAYGHVSLAYLASPVGKAATPEDLKILRELAISQNEEINEVVNGSFWFSRSYNMEKDLWNRLEAIDKSEPNSQQVRELSELASIYKYVRSGEGFLSGIFGGAYSYLAYLPQDLLSMFEERNYTYSSNTQEFYTQRLNEAYDQPWAIDTNNLQRGLGGVKFFETLNLEATQRNNLEDYLAIAAKTGMSYDDVVQLNKDSFDRMLALNGTISLVGLMASQAGEVGKSIALPYINKMAQGKAAKALALTGSELGADALANATATAPLEGAIEAEKFQFKSANDLEKEYNSVAGAFAWGMTNNFIGNMAAGAVLGSPFVARDMFHWAKDYQDVARVNKTFEEARKIKMLSTMETAPDATKKSVATTLKQQGYAEKNVYIYPEDLRDLRDNGTLDPSGMTEEQRTVLFGDLEKRIEQGRMVILSREDLAQYFSDTPYEEALNRISRSRATAVSQDELDTMDEDRRAYINEIAKENPDLATNTPEEREAAKQAVYHELQEQMVAVAHDRIASLALPKITNANITYASREIAGLTMTLIDEYNLPIEDAMKFFNEHMPTFGRRDTTLNIESGHAADKVRGTYDPDKNIIELTDDADINTLVHELSHYYLDMSMRLADEFSGNEHLARMKEVLYSGFLNDDPALLKKKWSDLDPELKERMQETFAYEYLKMRVERTFSPEDYTAANKLDEEGHKTGRTHVSLARFDRILAAAWAKYFGRDLRKMNDQQKKAEVQSTMLEAQAQFEKNYGIKEIPDNIKVLAAMIDSATTGFIDMHRVANLYPLGESILNIPGLDKDTAKRLKRTFELINDEFHTQLRLIFGAAGREEIKNMDKIYKARKKDIERNPEYKTMLKETKEVENTIEENKKDVTTVETQISDANETLVRLYAKRESINSPEYRKERGALKRRVTHLNKKLDTSNQRLAQLNEETLATGTKLAELEATNTANGVAYETLKTEIDATAAHLKEAMDKHEHYKQMREGYAEKFKAGEISREDLQIVQRFAKNQGDVVRRAKQKFSTLSTKFQEVHDAYTKSSTEHAVTLAKTYDLAAEVAELSEDIAKLNAELVEKQESLSIDPIAEINAEIKTTKEAIKQLREQLRGTQKTLSASKKRYQELKRRYKDAEANYSRELGELDKLYGDTQQQMEVMRERAAEKLDDPENDIGKLYQEATFWQEQLKDKELSDPIWNDALDALGAQNVESLKEYLAKYTDKKQLIEELAADMYADIQRKGVTRDMIEGTTVKTASKIFRLFLKFMDGSFSKSTRDARKIVRYTAKQFRAGAAQLRFGNVSSQQFITRAKRCMNKANDILTHPSRYESPDDMMADAYRQVALGEYFTEVAQTGVRMKRQIEKELAKVTRELQAKGVANRISAEHVAAAKAILGRMGVMRASNSEALLRQIKQDFPEQWSQVAPFFEDSDKRNVQHYSQMQLGDIFAMVDLVNVIIQNGKQALSDRKIAETLEMGKQAQAVRDAYEQLFIDRPDKQKERESVDAVNKPKDSQLTGWKKAVATIRSYYNSTLTMQAAAEMLDGNDHGAFKRNFYDPIAEANSRYITEDRELAESLKPMFEQAKTLFDPRDKSLPTKIVWKDRDGRDINIVAAPDGNIRKALVGILIHIGNDSNLNALCRSLNLDPDDFVKNIRQLERDDIINTDLMDHVQAFWDAYKPIGVKAQKAYNEINNRYFTPVNGRAIVFAGKEYAGGYAPLTRQRDALKADATLNEQLFDASHDLPPSYDPSFAQERSEFSALPLDLSYDGIMNGLSRQLRYAHLMPALNKVNNFAKHNPELMREIDILIPGFRDDVFLPWMRAVANQSSSDIKTSPIARMLGAAGARINQSIMALNISNAAQQVTGFIVATAKVSPGALLTSMVKPMARGDIFKLSDYMRTRLENSKASMSSIRRDLMTYGKYSETKNFLDDHAYILQTITQNWIDQRIWSAKYKEMLKKTGSSEQAALAADQAIRVTQGSFNIADTSAFDRGAMAKILVPFMNYFQSMGNLFRARLSQVNRGVNSRTLRAMNSILLASQIMIVPSLVAYAIAQSIKGYWFNANEEDAWMFMTDAWASAIGGAASSANPFVGQAFTLVYNLIMEKPTASSLINAPLVTLIPNAVKSSGRILSGIYNGDTENISTYDANNVLHVFNAAGFLPALGSAAATRAFVAGTLMGGWGDADPNGVIDATRAVVTGSLSDEQKGNR